MSLDVERLIAQIDVDPAKAIAELEAFKRASQSAAVDEHKTIHVDVDDDSVHRLQTSLGGLVNTIESVSGRLSSLTEGLSGVGGAGGDAGKGLSAAAEGGDSFFKSVGGGLPGILQAVGYFTLFMGVLNVLPGALSAAAAGAGALVGALAPLLGLLGAIPVGLGAFAGALGAIMSVMGPVMGGVQALTAQQKGLHTALDTSAQKAHAVTMALQALKDAQHSAAQSAQALADAQKEMAKAPAEAADALRHQRLAVRAAVLGEEEAVNRLRQAQENLKRAQEDTAKSGYDLTKQTDYFTGKVYEVASMSVDATDQAQKESDAKLAVKEAELALAQARENNRDETKKLNEMEKKGIKNSDIMVAARRRLADAEWNYKKSLQGVKNAEYNLAQSRRDAAKATNGLTAAQNNLNYAMGKLSPIGQEFVKWLVHDFIPAWDDVSKKVQNAFLPGFMAGLKDLKGQFGGLGDMLAGFGAKLGNGFKGFMDFWTRPKRTKELDHMFDGLLDVLGQLLDMATPLSRILVSITTAATPMVKTLNKGILAALNNLADWMETDHGKKAMTNFFNKAAKFARLWWNVMKPIGGILSGISKAAEPLATWMLSKLADHFGTLSKNINSVTGQRKLRKWFLDQKPVLHEVGKAISGIVDLLFGSSKGGKKSGFYKALKDFNDHLLPDLKKNFQDFDAQQTGKDIVSLADSLSSLADSLHAISAAADGLKTVMSPVTWLINEANKSHGPKKGQSWWERALFGNSTETEQGFKDWGKIFSGMKKKWKEFDNWWKTGPIGGKDGIGGSLRSAGKSISKWWSDMWDDNKKKTHTSLNDQLMMVNNWGITKKFVDKLDGVSKAVKDHWDKWKKDFRDGMDRIKGIVGDALDWIKNTWDTFKRNWKGKPPTFTGFFDGLIDAFISAMNWIIGKWNSFSIGFSGLKVAGKEVLPAAKMSTPDIDPLHRWSGGAVEKDKTYIVGEKRPEVFVPSTSGRIMPYTPPDLMRSNASGISDEQLQRVLDKVLEKAKAPVNIEQTFNEKVDPMHVGRELAWRLG